MTRILRLAIAFVVGVSSPALAQQASDLAQPGDGEFLVSARTIIQGQLLTGINSDLPGVIVAQITRDVWDQQVQAIVIPRGSFLTGSYGSSVTLGQDRLAIVWTQLELPNGVRYPLPGLSGTDRAGLAGVEGDVDNHFGRIVRATILSSIMTYGAATQMSEQQVGFQQQPSPRDQAISGGIGQIQGTVDDVSRRDLTIRPTIRIPQGQGFAVILGQDLIMPGYVSDR